jgi:hypothetical protein
MAMGYTIAGLRDQVRQLHPEIARQGINLLVAFDDDQQKYSLKLSKGPHEFGFYLDRADADACMDAGRCLNLSVQVTQALAEFEDLLTPRKPG